MTLSIRTHRFLSFSSKCAFKAAFLAVCTVAMVPLASVSVGAQEPISLESEAAPTPPPDTVLSDIDSYAAENDLDLNTLRPINAPASDQPSGGSDDTPVEGMISAETQSVSVSGTASAGPDEVGGNNQPDTPAEPVRYFDGTATPPGPLNVPPSGPVNVSPDQASGGTFIIVKKDYSAGSKQSLLVSANRALELGRYDAALSFFEDLYQKNPRDLRILMGLAIARQNVGQNELAVKTYDEILAIDPDNKTALVNMLGMLRELYPAVALRRLRTLNEQFPNNAGISAQTGIAAADLGNFDEALRYLGIAASLEPYNPHHYFNMAVIADRMGAHKDAIAFYEQALDKDSLSPHSKGLPRETIYNRLARLRVR